MNETKEKVIVKASGHEVIASGLAYTFEKNGEIELSLVVSSEKKLYFTFKFTDDGGEEPSIETESTEERLTIMCRDFNNSLGTGMKRAVKVGNYAGKPLYLTFLVYSFDEQKKLEYSFFV